MHTNKQSILTHKKVLNVNQQKYSQLFGNKYRKINKHCVISFLSNTNVFSDSEASYNFISKLCKKLTFMCIENSAWKYLNHFLSHFIEEFLKGNK